MANSDLFQELSGGKVEQSELEQVFLTHFGRASEVDQNTITYGGEGKNCSLVVMYTDGTLTKISPGPLLKDADITALKAKIKDELLTPGPVRVGRQILFTAVPVEGWFRYNDVFQIVPVPPEAPRPGQLIGDHPFLLEFRFTGSTNGMVRVLRRGIREREIELLLNGLLCWSLHSIGNRGLRYWVLPEIEDTTKWKSAYLQEMYTSPRMALEGDDFLPTASLTPLVEVTPTDYYARHGITAGQALDLPSGLSAMLDQFFTLPREDRDRFLRASFWFQYATRAFDYSQSAAYMALVSAVESIMPTTEDRPKCDKCGQSVGPGPPKMFIDFVEQFATGTSISKSDRSRFYGVRSAITHGARLLHSDRAGWGGSFTPAGIRERSDMTAMWRIVRIVLVNWLASRKV